MKFARTWTTTALLLALWHTGLCQGLPNPTSSLKGPATYQNPTLGCSVQLPRDWVAETSSTGLVLVYAARAGESTRITLDLDSGPASTAVMGDRIDKQKKVLTDSKFSIRSNKMVKVGGVSAARLDGTLVYKQNYSTFVHLLVPLKDGRFLLMQGAASGKSASESRKRAVEMLQVVDSFRL